VISRITDAEHRIAHLDPHFYSAHPHAVALPDGDWLLVLSLCASTRST
jgi:hypothetical protein